jgi:hypothetical protein
MLSKRINVKNCQESFATFFAKTQQPWGGTLPNGRHGPSPAFSRLVSHLAAFARVLHTQNDIKIKFVPLTWNLKHF